MEAQADPFLDLIRLLQPKATLWAGVQASGHWGLAFRQLEDLLFCYVERGMCVLTRPGFDPLLLQANDFVLVRTSTPFQLVSGPGAQVIGSESVIAEAGSVATFGEGQGPVTILRGGRFVFDTANEQLLTGLLPQVVHVAATDHASERVRMLLAMNEAESSAPAPGSAFVIARLMELLLVELLRSRTLDRSHVQTGLLAGLADPVTAQALTALHSDVARPWTTATLARHCGVSRSALGERFSRIVGMGPMQYLQRWRMALAKDELRRRAHGIGEIGLLIGFQSASAFSTAFTRAVGCSPRQFAEDRADGERNGGGGGS